MKYRELAGVKLGEVLMVNGTPLKVEKIQRYQGKIDSWLDLIALTPNGEWLVEMEGGNVREYKEVLDLPNVNPSMDEVDYRERHWEVDESRVRAKVIVETADEKIEEPSVCSVYSNQKDNSLLGIETRGGKTFVWYSDRILSPRDIIKKA
jgi:hypothetical protein